MTIFFFELTKRNWGAPYHILIWSWLAYALMILCGVIGSQGTAEQMLRCTIISLVVAMLIGWGYEWLQNKREKRQSRKEVVEDILCDLGGSVIGVGFYWLNWAVL